jgi:sterol desaturase/sphingolipid hydroxylase (fatty acid hydroxylase superfamily)
VSLLAAALSSLLLFWLRHGVFAAVASAVSGLGRRTGILRRVQCDAPAPRTVLREVLWSSASGAIFVAVATLLVLAAERGHTRIYMDLSTYGTGWLLASIACTLLAHDAYFYWAHRAMHEWRILRPAHRLHHDFTNPTSAAAFAFHPAEALIEAAILPIVAWTIPLHPLALFAFTTLMTAQSVVIHCGFELSPHRRHLVPLPDLWMGSRAHNDHHRGQRGNYGLYLTLWDVAMGTYVPAERSEKAAE